MSNLSACVLAINENFEVLAVSRKDNPNDFGLPGGKVDSGEPTKIAAIRELKEETGLDVVPGTLFYMFHSDDGEYETVTYLAHVYGTIKTSESGIVKWVKPEVLLKGCFADYNRKLFHRMGWL